MPPARLPDDTGPSVASRHFVFLSLTVTRHLGLPGQENGGAGRKARPLCVANMLWTTILLQLALWVTSIQAFFPWFPNENGESGNIDAIKKSSRRTDADGRVAEVRDASGQGLTLPLKQRKASVRLCHVHKFHAQIWLTLNATSLTNLALPKSPRLPTDWHESTRRLVSPRPVKLPRISTSDRTSSR